MYILNNLIKIIPAINQLPILNSTLKSYHQFTLLNDKIHK